MNCDHSCNQRGSTLIESLVALTLFSLMASAFGNLLVGHIHTSVSNAAQTTAIVLAERELEDLRAMDYPSIASRTGAQVIDGRTYSVATAVITDSPAPGIKSVTATVNWNELGRSQTYALTTLYSAVKS